MQGRKKKGREERRKKTGVGDDTVFGEGRRKEGGVEREDGIQGEP